jgi:hypothetical protein
MHLFPLLLDTWLMFWFFWIFCMDHKSWVLSLKSKLRSQNALWL